MDFFFHSYPQIEVAGIAEVVGSNPTRSISYYEETTVLN
jgi:hypothetical protein